MKDNEDMLQVFTADLLAAFKRPGIVAYHTPNGGKRHISVAKKLKKMGTLAGVADWTFLMPGARTAFLELKDGKRRQSDAQVDFQRDVEALGFRYELARTPRQVKDILIAWGRHQDAGAIMTAIDIIREVAEAHGVTSDMLRSRRYRHKLAEARRTAYRRLRDERGLSLVQIGQLMGGRDFATIASGISDKRRAAARRRYQQ